MKKSAKIYSILGVLLLASVAVIMSGVLSGEEMKQNNLAVNSFNELPEVKGYMDVYLVRDGDVISESHGPITDYSEDLKKVVYNDGLDAFADWASGVVDNGPYKNISTCNVSASGGCGSPVGAASEPFTANDACGLGSIQATTVYDNGVGNFTLEHTFTLTCSISTINVTRITNMTGGLFVGKTLDNPITNAVSSDTVTINATIYGTSA